MGCVVWHWAVPAAVAVLVLWLVLVAALWVCRPDARDLKQTLRLMPDVLRLLGRLARDRSLPVNARGWLWGLLLYLAMPIDVIPDFIPMIGYADDAILVLLALRMVARRIGAPALRAHWPGTEEGFAALSALTGLPTQ
jgi:uncharacterized membrane protein YkvA (DUF1232 family)